MSEINVQLLEGDKLKRAVDRMARRVRSWTEWVASVGVSVLHHAAVHGDVTLLNRFYSHLPNAYSKPFVMWLGANGVREWLKLENGEFTLKKSEDAKAARREFAENPRIEDWTSFRTRKQPSFDLDAVIRRIDSLKKDIEKEGLQMPEEFLNHLEAASSIALRLKDARETAMPVAA